MNAWSQSSKSLVENLGTDPEKGLTQAQIQAKLAQYGKNILQDEARTSRIKLMLGQFKSPMVYTLVLAAAIAFILSEHLNAIAILAIVILNALIGYFQETKAEAAISALKKLSTPKVRVLRDAKIMTVNFEEVFPGDILILEAGDYVVADARILEAFQLSTDEAVLTGESLSISKNSDVMSDKTELADRKNMLFAGTAISNGSGKAVVTSTGMNTELGHIAGLLEKTQREATPLQIRLEKVSAKLLVIAAFVILAVVIMGIIHKRDWFSIFMTAISLSVAAIPEGLPTVVTLALTLAVRRMTKRHALVRNMGAVETLGSTDIICTDKTGTLTTGKMQVREIFSLDELKNKQLIEESLILCNNASLDHGTSGDTTEIALLNYAKEQKADINKIKQNNPRSHEWSFESDRKRMSVAIDKGDHYKIFCKGAPDSILLLCDLSNEERKIIEEKVIELSSMGRRILALCWKKEVGNSILQKSHHEIEKDFKFLALVSMADPPKKESIDSIKKCRAAGIKVVMITGDHPITAKAIAIELGIPQDDFDNVLTGQELNDLSIEELRNIVEKTAVYARVTPEHKLRIIEALQSNGHVVSMTGDGVNDAPALKKASIGISMGKGGTEVARQASAMVLTNDDFSTIVAAVEEGRAIFGNIKRTIQYLLSTNLAEILVMLGTVLLGLPIPLSPLSLLWINLVTDGFPSLALAAEPVEKDYLNNSIRPSPESFFDKKFMYEMYFVGILMTLLEVSVYYFGLKNYDVLTARSYAFTLLVYLCLFRSFSCRSDKKIYFDLPYNPWQLASVLIPIVFQFIFQYTKLFQELFKVRSLSISENGILFVLGFIPVTIIEIVKWRRNK